MNGLKLKNRPIQNRTLDRWGSKVKVAMTSNFNLELLLRMELPSI
jgi:hypothetical protein